MNENVINEIELRKAITQIHPNGQLFEVRIIQNSKKNPLTGYFRDADTLIDKLLNTVDLRRANIYMTINQVNDDLANREQYERFMQGSGFATNDKDIVGYDWLFIDLDPERPTGISSNKEELQKAFDLAKKVQSYLSDLGFEEPVKAVSGNGAHLLYRISLANNDENRALVERCLKALSMMFDDDGIKVDTTTFNQSRICKLYGTRAQKGRDTKERPHRLSRIIGEVKDVRATDKAYLEKLASQLPDESPQRLSKYNGYGAEDFDIENWMNKYGLRYTVKPFKDGTKYILDECPFDSNHKAPDSMITKGANGAIGFKCLHNSCSEYHWKDLRLKFEPDAYEYNDGDRRIEEGWRKHNRDRAIVPPVINEDDDTPLFRNARMILDMESPEPEFIRSGIAKIDKALNGLEKGKLSVISGLRASAKSTLLGEIMLNAVDDGHTVVCYSGELSNRSFLNWIMLQAAGKRHVLQSAKYEGSFYVDEKIESKIADWMDDKFWLYTNRKDTTLDLLLNGIREQCRKSMADLVIIDNLMSLDVGTLNRNNEYNAQTKFMWDLKQLAQDCNAHVILVAHPRKAQGFLRVDDIAGTSNIGNIIDNCFIVHRNNNDFQRLSKSMFGWRDDFWLFQTECTNVLEIAKDREHGTCDVFVDLYFEVQTKRLKNYKDENKIYGWDSDFYPVDADDADVLEDIWKE